MSNYRSNEAHPLEDDASDAKKTETSGAIQKFLNFGKHTRGETQRTLPHRGNNTCEQNI